jgi:alpha-mannosidase
MTAYDGMRDAGKHSFDYALKSYDCCLAESSVHADGLGFNARLPVKDSMDALELPQLTADNAWISAVCLAHNGKDLVVRVAEYRGKTGNFTLSLPPKIKRVHETDLKEDVIKTFAQGVIEGTMNPFEIKTFILEV